MEGLNRLANMFRVADLRKKILFTLFIISCSGSGSHIPVPYVDFKAIQELQSQSKGRRRRRLPRPVLRRRDHQRRRSSSSGSCRTSRRRSSCSCSAS